MHYTFWYISLPSPHDYCMKFPDGTFYGGRKHTTKNFFFLFLNVGAVSKNSSPENVTYICHLRQVGIIATTFEKTQIHFNSDVLAAVALVVAKFPFYAVWRTTSPLCNVRNSTKGKYCAIALILKITLFSLVQLKSIWCYFLLFFFVVVVGLFNFSQLVQT